MALAMVAVTGATVGLAWAGQVSTVRLCEEDNPARCEGGDARLQHSSANPASPNFDPGVFPNGGPNVGFSLAIGYLNGDGFADLLVGAPGEDRVYVILGGVDLDVASEGVADRSTGLETRADLILQGVAGSKFGHSVAVGPHNGMTRLNNAIIVGAPQWTDGAGTRGRAYSIPASFWASPGASPVDITTVATVNLDGENDGDEAGYAVGIGPVLTAGADDRIVTARRANGGAGAIYAVAAAAGSGDLSTATAAVAGNPVDPCVAAANCGMPPEFPVDEGLGEFIAIADFQDDGGRHEVAVGAVGVDGNDNSPGNIPGHVYILDMANAPALADAAHRIVGGNVNDFFGFSLVGGSLIAGAGPELAVGAIYADRDSSTCDLSTRTNVGAAYVFDSSVVANVAAGMGPADVTDADITYRGQRNWDEFGFALALGVRAHTAGTYDLAISARRADRDPVQFNQVDEGAVYLFGAPLATGEQCLDCPGGDCSMNPPAADAMIYGGDYNTAGVGASDEIGFSLAFGDLNGGDTVSPNGRLFDDLAISSVTQERVYLVALENHDNPAVDGAASDAYRDIEDRDDDGDGYADTDEDFNTNGVLDLLESDALTPNRDVTVAVTTNNGGNNLDCDGSIDVTVTVTNVSPVLTVLNPLVQITIPGAPFQYEPNSTDILLNGVVESADFGATFLFSAAPRAMTQSGANRTVALAPGDTVAVRFQLNLPVQLDWAEAQIASGDVSAVVSLGAPDINELPYPHAAGISQTNNASRTINLRRPNLDITKASFLLNSDTNGELNAGEMYRYTITIQNNGNLAARNVVLSDIIDANAVLNTGSVTVTCASCTTTNITLPATALDPLVVTMDTINPGAQAIVRFQVTADEDLANNTPIVNQATVAEVCLEDRYSDSSDASINDGVDIGNDPALTDDDDPNTDTVRVTEAITLQGNVLPANGEVGAPIVYTFTATTGAGTVRLDNITFGNVPAQNPARCAPSATPVSGDTNSDLFLDWAETGSGAETWTFTCNYTVLATDPVGAIDNWVRISGDTPAGNTVSADVNIQFTVDNTPPVANDDPGAGADYNAIIEIDVLANDTDANIPGGDQIDIQSVDAASALGGSATIVPCSFNNAINCIEYTTPADVGSTTDTFDYVVADLNGGTNSATVTVAIGAPPVLSIDSVMLAEGNNPNTTNFVFTVTLTGNTGRFDVMVDVDTMDGTAQDNNPAGPEDNDYVAVNTTRTFTNSTAGPQTMNVTVVVDGDNKAEADETFTVLLSSPTHAVLAGGGADVGTGTIQNDDSAPTISIGDAMIAEGASGANPTLQFTVTLSNPSASDVTMSYAASDGIGGTNMDATLADNDYAPAAMTGFTIMAGMTTGTIDVTINGDDVFELDESFFVTLGSPVNASILDGQAVGTILNDDAAPTLSVSDDAVLEGASGANPTLNFTVTQSFVSTVDTTFNWTTTDGSATVADGDYVAGGAVGVVIPAGMTAAMFSVTVNGDDVFENDEGFTVDLGGLANATLLDGQGDGTIQNDDSLPTISIGDVTAAEDGGNFDFTVTLSAVSGADTTVDYTTVDGTATVADGDYAAAAGMGVVVIPAGMAAGTISVTINADTKFELDEDFTVVLSNPGGATFAMVGDEIGTGTITNDDTAPTVSIDSPALAEGNSGETPTMNFTVTLSNATYLPVSLDFVTAGGTATEGVDYVASAGSGGTALMIPAGSTTAMLPVTLTGDDALEPDEDFTMTLSNPVNASFAVPGDAIGTGTILDDGDIVRIAPQPPVFNGFDGNQIGWGVTPQAVDYHLYRGDLAALRSTGTYTQNPGSVADAKRFCFVGGTAQTDTYAPAPGGVLFYLITADDGFMESQLGRNAAGDLRPNTDPCR